MADTTTPITVDFAQLQAAAQKRRDTLDSEYQALGYKRIGGKYLKVDTPADQLSQNLDLQQKSLNLQKTQNELDPNYVKPAAPAKLSAAQQDQIAQSDTVTQNIADLRNLLKSSNFDTGKSQVIKSGLRGVLGSNFPGLHQSDAEQQFQALSNNTRAAYQKLISGAAISEPEAKRLAKFLPDITDTRQELENKFKELEKVAIRTKTNLQNTVKATGSSTDFSTEELSQADDLLNSLK